MKKDAPTSTDEKPSKGRGGVKRERIVEAAESKGRGGVKRERIVEAADGDAAVLVSTPSPPTSKAIRGKKAFLTSSNPNPTPIRPPV